MYQYSTYELHIGGRFAGSSIELLETSCACKIDHVVSGYEDDYYVLYASEAYRVVIVVAKGKTKRRKK